MIITRTPFRISFVGGGTDLPEFYLQQPGAVVSMAINKYVYIAVNKRFTDAVRVSYYARTEIVEDVEEIQHALVREALKLVGVTRGIEITSIADVHAGAGLGSSGSFTVGLLNALYAYVGVLRSAEELAREACHLEIDVLGDPVGKQDQYIAAYGGFRYIQFNDDGSVVIEHFLQSKEKDLVPNLLLLYTGQVHEARVILGVQKLNTMRGQNTAFLTQLRDAAIATRNGLNNGASPDIIGRALHEGWVLKRRLAEGITNTRIDEYYQRALEAGALGGKVAGAGGGGFLLLYCPGETRRRVVEALPELRPLEFSFEPEGSKIVYVT